MMTTIIERSMFPYASLPWFTLEKAIHILKVNGGSLAAIAVLHRPRIIRTALKLKTITKLLGCR